MDNTTYHIKIKQEYASAILEDLLQADAIEIIEDAVPEWQQQETLKRLQKMKDNPESVVSYTEIVKLLESDDE